jgi:hypothetical protein
MSITHEQIEQIRRAHASAKPKRENPAWWNTHRDLGVVLDYLQQQEQTLRDEFAGRAMQSYMQADITTTYGNIARGAYDMADAMLIVRENDVKNGVEL